MTFLLDLISFKAKVKRRGYIIGFVTITFLNMVWEFSSTLGLKSLGPFLSLLIFTVPLSFVSLALAIARVKDFSSYALHKRHITFLLSGAALVTAPVIHQSIFGPENFVGPFHLLGWGVILCYFVIFPVGLTINIYYLIRCVFSKSFEN